MTEFKGLAKELDLSQEAAQKVADLGAKLVAEGSAAAEKVNSEAWIKAREGWVADLKSDPGFGGEQFGANVELANRALREYGSEELIAYLGETGLGDYPELVKMFAKIGKTTGPMKSVGGNGAVAPKSAAEALYPSMRK